MKDPLNLVYLALIITMVAVSTGHVGQLFAQRETEKAEVLGYVFALALDGVLVIALHQVTRSAGWYRVVPLAVFFAASTVSGGFNYQYYRETSPLDPVWLSAALGITPPALASLMSVLRALRQNTAEEAERQEQETERQVERNHELAMESLRIEGETTVQIAVGTAKQTTAQERARARRAQAEVTQRQAQEAEAQQEETRRRQIESLGVYRATLEHYRESPHSDRATAAIDLGVSERTITNHLKHLEGLGLLRRNGSGGIEILEEVK